MPPTGSRLLEATGEVDPRWVMFLDADERLSADDAVALRAFVRDEAAPDDAYLFPVHRMVGDERHYDRALVWVGRLFAHRAGLRLPTERLHLVPIPTSIPRRRWRRTTLRIQHLAGLTPEDRRAQFEKYRQVDPDGVFQTDYSHLLAPNEQVREWRPRDPQLPVVAEQSSAGP